MYTLFSPHITSPSLDAIFNLGKVLIEWRKNDPVSDDPDVDTNLVTYEIEYTDNYEVGRNTVWRTLKRRIPWDSTSYTWVVGKMIKSKSVRLRMRAKDSRTEISSDWSMSPSFSINVFDLIAPFIVSPNENRIYTDFIVIAWDETPIKDTFHQKVRYTVEYSSDSQSIGWTIIAANIPVGQNVVRWDVSEITPAEDYVIRLTARDTSAEIQPGHGELDCQEADQSPAEQIAVRYIYNIKIRHSGLFIIDTVPPITNITIEGNTKQITNQRRQILNIMSEDATTQVETIRLANCDASDYMPLGNIDTASSSIPCPLELLVNSEEIPYSQKIVYDMDVLESGFRKIQVLASDSGGNLSIQKPTRLFLPFFQTSGITDFIIFQRQQDIQSLSVVSEQPILVTTTETFEVMCATTSTGEVWILDPFPRLQYTLSVSIDRTYMYKGVLYFFSHCTVDDGEGGYTDLTEVWRDTGLSAVVISPVKSDSNPTDHFQKDYAISTSVGGFDDLMFVGFANGELWSYDGLSWTKVTTFSSAINSLTGDGKFLYIGFQNSEDVVLYNGTSFYTLAV